jgi:chromosome segregation ATPase
MDGVNHNGSGKSTNLELPAAREAVIEQAQRVYQEVAHERDQLLRKVGELQSDIAGYKVALEAHSSMEAQRDSRMATLQAERDMAVRQCAEVRTVLHNIMTIGQPYLHSQLPVTSSAERGGQADDWELDREAEAIKREHAVALRQHDAAGPGPADRPGARRAVPDALAGEGGLRVQSALDR